MTLNNQMSLADLRDDPEKVVQEIAEGRQTVALTQDGQEVAVIQSKADYEAAVEEREFMRGVVAGLNDLEEGRRVSIDDVRRDLALD